ncbi:hypothetical protein XELAEV_18026171mg [Xenopus laevis]|uniref:Uncharacterized protein n=1 Tax=Xenopus laevis TaxID=8355 RepID=A0A974CTF6_XENLA|nr:hypothetical protein XELAEV_18026171mg [Xenopus laevis]
MIILTFFKAATCKEKRKCWHKLSNKHTVAQLRWNILEQVTTERGGNIRKRLLEREAVWIKRLDSLTPMGLNESFNMRCFL